MAAAGDFPDSTAQAEALVALAMAEPRRAAEEATRLLTTPLSPRAQTYCHHALGIVYRDRGDSVTAIRSLREGKRLAVKHGMTDRAADIGATLGSALVLSGRTTAGLSEFDAALSASTDLEAARVRMRRGVVLHWVLGRSDEALRDFTACLAVFRRHGDRVWTSRTLYNRAKVLEERGDLARGARALAEAESAGGFGTSVETVTLLLNRAWICYLQGDLPSALSHLDRADEMAAVLGDDDPLLAANRSTILLAAGLAADAQAAAERALSSLPARGNVGSRGAVLYQAAEAARATGDHPRAAALSRDALRLFRRLGNDVESRMALLALGRASLAAGPMPASLRRQLAARTPDPAADAGQRAEAALRTARAALAAGDERTAVTQLAAAARARRSAAPLRRADGWLAAALLAEVRGRPADVLRSADRGLTVLDEHRLSLGAGELRAAATAHGAELAALALRHAARRDDPASLLAWSERWRATALAVPPVRPPRDRTLARDLAALRAVTRRIAEARADGEPTTRLERERAALEQSTRARTLHRAGAGHADGAPEDVTHLADRLGGGTLVELVAVDDVLHALVVDRSGIRRFRAGTLSEAAQEVEHLRFTLHRLARPGTGRGAAALASAAEATLRGSADALGRLLLGDALSDVGDGPLVVVPPGRLHAVPWGLLPGLTERVVHVAPSAAAWLRATRRPEPSDGRIALVQGPDLGTGGAEVPHLAALWPDAEHLDAGTSAADAVLEVLDGARLAHIAAHGSFRADNPMFSALQVADGPLTVHDLEALGQAPHRVVLSACESGLGAPTGADEILGLAAALLGLGTAGLVASVVPVNDEATVPMMLTVHERLAAGGTLAEGLRDAREAAAGDAVAAATAGSFVALGAV